MGADVRGIREVRQLAGDGARYGDDDHSGEHQRVHHAAQPEVERRGCASLTDQGDFLTPMTVRARPLQSFDPGPGYAQTTRL